MSSWGRCNLDAAGVGLFRILCSQGLYIDVLTILSDARLIEALALPHEKPASLLQMVQRWPYWRATLPMLAGYWYNSSEQAKQQSLLKADDIHWLPPLIYPNKLICLGANYNDHNAEMENTQPPKFPYCFYSLHPQRWLVLVKPFPFLNMRR